MKENLKYMINNWLKWDRNSVIFFFVRVPALVFQPIITALIPKVMIDCIEKGVTVSRLTLVVALLSLLLTLTIWLDPFMKELVRGGARIVRMRYAVMAFRKSLYTDYINIESPSAGEKQKRAEDFYSARFSSGADIIEICNQFLVCVVGVIASAALIVKVNFFMILLILATCIGEFLILKLLNKKQRSTLDIESKLNAEFEYFYKLSKDPDASKDIELYGLRDHLIKAAADIVSAVDSVISKFTRQSASFNFIRALLNLVREVTAWGYLVYLVTSGRITVSDFVFYFGIITGFSKWVVSLVYSYSGIERCCNDCAAYREYVESGDENTDKPDIDFDTVESIEFRDVYFTYPEAEKSTINGMSFKISKGENIAIVGENGAGKTTAVKLLCGLYSPTDGEILINGKNSRDFSSSSYYDLFSAVFQDHYFLPMTIAQNITASFEYDRERLRSAFKKAGILEKIESLPDKENSMADKTVYKNAVDFSGGEKQKLLLAKAVYKDAPVLILDEPTAALDPIAENELYLKYNELTENKLSFFISHRLSSTRFCDRILFIGNGRITESGTHDELMKLKGAYYRMYQMQSSYYKGQGVNIDE